MKLLKTNEPSTVSSDFKLSNNLTLDKLTTNSQPSISQKKFNNAGQRRLKSENANYPVIKDRYAEVLLKYGNNPKKWSPLNYAIDQGDLAAALILVQYGHDIHETNEKTSPWERVIRNLPKNQSADCKNLITELLKKGAYYRNYDLSVIFSLEWYDVIELVIPKDPQWSVGLGYSSQQQVTWAINHGAKFSYNHLVSFYSNQWKDLCEFIITKKEVNINDLNGDFLARRCQSIEDYKWAFNHGAKPNASPQIFENPIMLLNTELLNFLMENGARPVDKDVSFAISTFLGRCCVNSHG